MRDKVIFIVKDTKYDIKHDKFMFTDKIYEILNDVKCEIIIIVAAEFSS